MSETTLPKKKGLSFPGAKAKVTIVKAVAPAPITSEKAAAAVAAATVKVQEAPRPVVLPSSRRSLNIFAKRETPGSVKPVTVMPINQKPITAKPVTIKPVPVKQEVLLPIQEKKEKPRIQFKEEPNIKLITPLSLESEKEEVEEDKALIEVKAFFDRLKEEDSLNDYDEINIENLTADEPGNDGRYYYTYDNDIDEDFTNLNGLFQTIEFKVDGFYIDKTDSEKVEEEKQQLFELFHSLDKDAEEEKEAEEVEADEALIQVKAFFDRLKEEDSLNDYDEINIENLTADEPGNDGRYFYTYDNDIDEDFTSLNGLFETIEFGVEGFYIDKTDSEKVEEEKQHLFELFHSLDKEVVETKEKEKKTVKPTSSIEKLLESDTLGSLAENILRKEGRLPEDVEGETYADKYAIEKPTQGFIPQNRRAFANFIYDTFQPFKLPPLPAEPDPNACMTAMQADRSEMYKYQKFIREYMSWQTPYRGILVYHGLGSGKTCTSIAAAEALFSTNPSPARKIIVMTPFSLRQNFIGEITTCGFQHFRLRNHWTKHSLSDPLVKTFATSVMQIPSQYLEKVNHIWIPDFTREQNYQAPATATLEQKAKYLTSQQQSEVRDQITNILVYDPKKGLHGRIWFISYNGFTKKDLLKLACDKPDAFDNAVIIIDEIHNMVRIMQGTIEPYLTKLTGIKAKRKVDFEPISWEKWKPKMCPTSWEDYEADKDLRKKSYKRGYLFYRLLTQATNSKIIGLSGTPLINFAEELGILSNLLHGYNHIVHGSVPKADVRQKGSDATDKATVEKIRKILTDNLFTDFQDVKTTEKEIQFRTTFLPEAIQKLPGQAGVIRAAPGEPIVTFAERLASLQADFEAAGLKLIAPKGAESKFTIHSEPLLPPIRAEFEEKFINSTDNVTIENNLVLIKRLTGLVSFYKGSREDLMPRIRIDETVFVPMSIYQQTQYSKARLEEIDIEEKKEKKKKEEGTVEITGRLAALFAEVYEIKNMPQSSNYRMASRQTCNFAFPADVNRPRPRNKQEEETEIGEEVLDIVDTDISEGADLGASSRDEQAAAAAVEAEEEEEREIEAGLATGLATGQTGGSTATETETDEFDEEAARKEAIEDAELTEEADIREYIDAMRELHQQQQTTGTLGTEQKRCRAIRLAGETYPQQIERAKTCLATVAVAKLKLGQTGLGETSPKFQKMLENIGIAPGSSLVYSQFLQMEGIGIFALAMEANGYDPIEIKFNRHTNQAFFSKRTKESLAKGPSADPSTGIKQLRYIKFTGEDEDIVRRYALLLFNARFSELPKELSKTLTDAGWNGNDRGDLCRVFCITSAGAEGLSLKNVRAVHIMEPYWNDVRTAQVKGRAVRICSHAELPPEERTVDIFTYVSVFSKEAQVAKTGVLQIAEKIVNRDSLSDADAKIARLPISAGALQYTLTSDQRLWLISNRKKALIENLQKVMKSAAVDCKLNYEENKERDPEKAFKCKTLAYDKVGDFMYDPNLELDIEDTRRYKQPVATKPVTTTVATTTVTKPVTTTAKPVTTTTAPVTVAAKKKMKAKIQEVDYWLEPEVDATGKTVKFYLYAESDKDMKRRIGEIAAIESKKTPGTYGPKGSTLKLY